MKQQCLKMKKVILDILVKNKKLEEFNLGSEFHSRIEKEGYMPLVIERHGRHVMVTHYYSQNGDSIPDPDMEFVIAADGEWYPVALQLCTGHYTQARWSENGKDYINPRACAELKSFSNMWAQNLRAQGW